MQVIRAEAMGFCFGVRDALQVAREIESPAQVTIRGELVHNASVNQSLQDQVRSSVSEGWRARVRAWSA